MFNLLETLSDTYTWPVTLKIPASNGKVTEVKFHAEFNRLSAEAEQELTDEVSARIKKIMQSAKDVMDGETPDSDDDMARVNLSIRDQVLVSVGEADKSGNYTAAESDKESQLLSLRGATEAILNAYGQSKKGEKAKN